MPVKARLPSSRTGLLLFDIPLADEFAVAKYPLGQGPSLLGLLPPFDDSKSLHEVEGHVLLVAIAGNGMHVSISETG